jgi:RimJ/RimL family protein N-acetyltransferase
MSAYPELRTARLLLRQWRDSDRAPFAALNADSQVREYFPGLLTKEQSDGLAEKLELGLVERGFGFWAVEAPGVADFIGFIGISVPNFEAHFMPSVEIGWRLAREHWGKGYATEGARATMDHAFETLLLPELVSMTVPGNVRSRRVMEKLGFTRRDADDFDHPAIAEGHPLRRHVLYRLPKSRWYPMVKVGPPSDGPSTRGATAADERAPATSSALAR